MSNKVKIALNNTSPVIRVNYNGMHSYLTFADGTEINSDGRNYQFMQLCRNLRSNIYNKYGHRLEDYPQKNTVKEILSFDYNE